MAEREIIPYICFEGEGRYPATGCYVIWYRCYKTIGQNQKVECHLAYTDEDGKLHPLGDDFINPTVNKVTLDKLSTGLVFTIHNFKRWYDIKKESSVYYKVPVRFGPADFIGMFFVFFYGGSQISLKELLDKDLIREGKVLRGKNTSEFLGKDEKYWIELPCDYPLYLYRMRALIKELNKRLKSSMTRIGKLMACASLIDQSGNLVAARGRSAWQHWFLNLGKEKKGQAAYAYFETRLLQRELIEPLRKEIQSSVKKSSNIAKQRISAISDELSRLLKNQKHNKAFEQYFKKELKDVEKEKEIPSGVRESYMHAYALLSRVGKGEHLYQEHFKKFLSQCNTKNKNQIKEAIESIKEQAGWVRTLRGEMLSVVEAYGTLKLGKDLTDLRDDLVAASRFLEDRGIAHNIDDLEEKLNKSILFNQKVDASDYYSLPKSHIGWKAFNNSVSALKLVSVMMKDHDTLVDKIESANTLVGITEDISKIEAIKGRVPVASVVAKAAGVITNTTDWALSIHKLYKAAGKGDGIEFSQSVISYGGKGIALGGTIVGLIAFPPLGLALGAIGGAIDILSDVVGFVANYKSADLKKFQDAFDKLKKLDSNDEIHIHYRVLNRQKVTETSFYQELVQEPELKRAMGKKWTSTWGSDPLKLNDIIENYFNNHTWGLIDALT